MKRTRSDLIKVGLFVTVSGALLAGGLLWLAGAHLFRPVHTYTVLFERSVSGLNAGANVEYQGVVVGRVRDIQLTADLPPRVAVIVDLDPGTPVRADTSAALVGSLVTGIQFVQLQGGSVAAEALPPGGTIPGTAPSLEAFRERLADIADRVSDILRGLQENVFTRENGAKFNVLLRDLGDLVASLNNAIAPFQEKETPRELAELVRQLSAAATNANAVLTDFRARREDIFGGLAASLHSMDATARAAGDLVRRTDAQVAGTGRSLDALLGELATAITRLQETLDVIRSDPSMLLWGRSVPERER
jgi:phospholipid/cholesterol/gamma-HCH transport system substrate-binding protein